MTKNEIESQEENINNVKELRKTNTQLEIALNRRKEFLEKHPHMQDLQFKINDLMAGAGTFDNKVVILKNLINEQLINLKNHLQDLQNSITSFKGEK
jgi:hypothetical protein